MKIMYFILIALLSAVVMGCAAQHTEKVDKHYSTVTEDLARDTDRARRENAAGIAFIEQGDWDKAVQAFQQALEADVTFGPAHNNLGNAYYHQSKYYLAAWEFQYAIKMMPYSVEARSNLGMVLEAVERFDDAVKTYDEALALQPQNPEVIGNDVRARVRRGDRDSDVNDLLSKIVMNDTRPDWADWAREMLVLRRPALNPTTTPTGTGNSSPIN